MRKDRLCLGAFLYATGHHIAAWRHASSDEMGGHDFRVTIECAKTLERSKFDLLFFEDGLGIRDWDLGFSFRVARSSHIDAITHSAAVATVTSRIGIVATASTSFHEPYNVARQFASLDHLSGGRAGWNLVTSSSDVEARNFGRDAIALHADRYARAEEFADAVMGLWNTWEDGALLADKSSGIFYDDKRVHTLDHKGRHFSVRGPLNVARSPQGQPVIVQAGSSDDGKNLGARTAEAIFTANQTIKEAQEFYSDVKDRMRSFGRAPEDMKIMPGLFPVVGRDEAEARAKFEELQGLLHPAVGLQLAGRVLGNFDLSKYDIDGPIPELPASNSLKSRPKLVMDLARREGLTIRQLCLRIAGGRGHLQVVGTPTQIADEMEERFMANGADGFIVMPPTLPGGLDDFTEFVVPELQRRGLFRTEYEGTTLRANMGTRPGKLSGPERNAGALRSSPDA